MSFVKKIIYLCSTLFVAILFLNNIVQALPLTYYLSVGDDTPTSTFTGKYGCSLYLGVDALNIGGSLTGYNSFSFYMGYDNTALDLFHTSITSILDDSVHSSNLNGLYHVDGATQATPPLYQISNARLSKFYVKPKLNGSLDTNSILDFVSLNGDPLLFGNGEGADNTNISDTVDILSGVYPKTLYFEPRLCSEDIQPPLMPLGLNSPAIPATPNAHFIGTGWMSGTVSDWRTSNGNYRYQGLTKTLNNYIPVVGSDYVDNQYGVNSGTFIVTINNNNASAGSTETYYYGDSELIVSNYVGQNPIYGNQRTWESERRAYDILFKNSDSNIFEVEKQFTVNVKVYDNTGHNNTSYQMNKTFTFNTPVPPIIELIDPAIGTQNVAVNTPKITFKLADTWAGVDTGSVWITVRDTTKSGQLYTGYTYSGTDLHFTGATGTTPYGTLGNANGYDVWFNPVTDFPSDSWIYFSGIVVDLAGSTGYTATNQRFKTKASCNDLGCMDDLRIYTGNYATYTAFTGGLLIITGTNPNSIYPYFTGVDNNTLICGDPTFVGVELTGDVDIFDVDGTTIINGDIYTGFDMYITGLDFTYDPVTGIVEVQ